MNRLLSIGRRGGQQREDFVTRYEWAEIFKDYDRQAAYHVANLAAHNWDIAIINDRCFIGTSYCGSNHWLDKDGTKTDVTTEENDLFYPKIALGDFTTEGLYVRRDNCRRSLMLVMPVDGDDNDR